MLMWPILRESYRQAVTASALVAVGVDEVFPLACRVRSSNPCLLEVVEPPQSKTVTPR